METGVIARSVNMLGRLGKTRVLVIVAGVVVVVGLAVFASGLGQRLLAPGSPAAAQAASQPGFVEFRQPQAGFAVAYPGDWARVPDPDPQVALLASNGAGYSFQVRVLTLATLVGPTQLPAAQQFTDQIVTSNKSVKMLAGPQQITLGGLAGYFYLYTFTDPVTGQSGAHSHFFLFKGNTMISLVFQAIPAEAFRSGAATFDHISASFRVLQPH